MINDIILASFLLTLNRFYQCSKDRQRLYWTAPEFRLPQICILFSGCLKFGLLRTSWNATAEKVSVYGVFLVLIFPHSKLNTEIYSVKVRENKDQKTSEYGHFLRSVVLTEYIEVWTQTFTDLPCFYFSKVIQDHKIWNSILYRVSIQNEFSRRPYIRQKLESHNNFCYARIRFYNFLRTIKNHFTFL